LIQLVRLFVMWTNYKQFDNGGKNDKKKTLGGIKEGYLKALVTSHVEP